MSTGVSNDLSLRHFPEDLSEESVSFQIPGQADSSNLLDDITDDFFGSAIDSINTPLPPKPAAKNDPASRPASHRVFANPVDIGIVYPSTIPSPVGRDIVSNSTPLVVLPVANNKHAKSISADISRTQSMEQNAPTIADASHHPFVPVDVNLKHAANQNAGKPVRDVKVKQVVDLPAKPEHIPALRAKSKPKPVCLIQLFFTRRSFLLNHPREGCHRRRHSKTA